MLTTLAVVGVIAILAVVMGVLVMRLVGQIQQADQSAHEKTPIDSIKLTPGNWDD